MRALTLRIFEILPNKLYQSPALTSWQPIAERNISVIFDLEGGLDNVIPVPQPDTLTYICHPILDGPLPNMDVMHALARLGATLLTQGQRVLSHCAAGINRASLMNGLILWYYDPRMSGRDIVKLIQERRPGALSNRRFRAYLEKLPPQAKS